MRGILQSCFNPGWKWYKTHHMWFREYNYQLHPFLKGGLYAGAAEDNGRKLGQAFVYLLTIHKYSVRQIFHGNFCRLSKGDLRLPVHRMELGRIRFPASWLMKLNAEIYEAFLHLSTILTVQQGSFFTCFIIEDVIVQKRFVINSYLRARLEKIESQVWHYTGPGDAGSRMTQVLYERPLAIIHDSRPPYQEEAAFAVSFRETGTSLLNSLVLKHLPGGAWDPGNFCCEYFC